MAPTEHEVEWQTSEIMKYLLEDEDCCTSFRSLDPEVVTDGPSFDPVKVADRLRIVADSLNENPQFKAALSDLKQAAAQEALEVAISHGVETLCNTSVCQRAEVAPEIQIIRATVAFGLYIKKSSPHLRASVQSAMTTFLNRRLGSWIIKQGGWDKVANLW